MLGTGGGAALGGLGRRPLFAIGFPAADWSFAAPTKPTNEYSSLEADKTFAESMNFVELWIPSSLDLFGRNIASSGRMIMR